MPISPDDPAIRPWEPRQPVDHKRLNELQSRVVTEVTASPGTGLRIIRKGNQVAIAALPKTSRPAAPPIFRMKVVTPNVAPDVVLASRWDGTTLEAATTAVRVYWMREVNEEIYAFVPVGGTDAIDGNGLPVTWVEVDTPPTPQYQGQAIVATTQNRMGLDFPRAYALPGV